MLSLIIIYGLFLYIYKIDKYSAEGKYTSVVVAVSYKTNVYHMISLLFLYLYCQLGKSVLLFSSKRKIVDAIIVPKFLHVLYSHYLTLTSTLTLK